MSMVLSLYAETPLHPGVGQSTGMVDLPISREVHTGFPTLAASGLKGSLRETAKRRLNWPTAVINCLFGPETDAGELHAGAFAPSDGRLLAFPVRSLEMVFAWVTCPLALARLRRDLRLGGVADPLPELSDPRPGRALAADSVGDSIVLHDLVLDLDTDEGWKKAARWIARKMLPDTPEHAHYREKCERHLLLVCDEDFQYLVESTTAVAARIQLNEEKTTTGGGGNLWYEETVPSDSLFYFLVLADKPRVAVDGLDDPEAVVARLEQLVGEAGGYLRVGGNETVGQGWCAIRPLAGE